MYAMDQLRHELYRNGLISHAMIRSQDSGAILLDVSGAGHADIAILDLTGDGYADAIALDTKGLGAYTMFLVDTDGNNIPDTIMYMDAERGFIERAASGKDVEAAIESIMNAIFTSVMQDSSRITPAEAGLEGTYHHLQNAFRIAFHTADGIFVREDLTDPIQRQIQLERMKSTACSTAFPEGRSAHSYVSGAPAKIQQALTMTLFPVESEAYQAFSELKRNQDINIQEAVLLQKKGAMLILCEAFENNSGSTFLKAFTHILSGPVGLLLEAGEDRSSDILRNGSLLERIVYELGDDSTAIFVLARQGYQHIASAFNQYNGNTANYDASCLLLELEEAHNIQEAMEQRARAALRRKISGSAPAESIDGRETLRMSLQTLSQLFPQY